MIQKKEKGFITGRVEIDMKLIIKMDPLNNFMLNNKIYTNNNNILLEVTSKLNGLISDLTDNKAYKIIIARIKDIINLVNNVINENKKNTILILLEKIFKH